MTLYSGNASGSLKLLMNNAAPDEMNRQNTRIRDIIMRAHDIVHEPAR
jgi:hypothetical protein